MNQPALTIIVISYNTREMTLECLRSIARETSVPHEVIVLDNGSADSSADAIAEAFPGVRLIAEPVNHGFARANNMAARVARGTYLVLLNSDTVVLDGAIDTLHAFAGQRPGAGIWGGRTIFADGSPNPSSCWRRMDLWNLFCRAAGLTAVFPGSALLNAEAYGGWDRMTERAVDIVSGCFLMIRRADWERLGGFDERFFMYAEEADLCLRARHAGLHPRVTPRACIVHHGGASTRLRAERMLRLLRFKRALIGLHFTAWQRPFARVLFDAWPLSRNLGYRLAHRFAPAGRHAENASAWSEVWARREEWRRGLD